LPCILGNKINQLERCDIVPVAIMGMRCPNPPGNGFLIKDRKCVYDNARILTTLFAPV